MATLYLLPFIFLIFNCSTPKEVISVSDSPSISLLRSVKSENLQPTRWDTGDTTVSNEDRLDLLIPHVTGIGGVYVGVGSEQNLTIAAWAGSEFIYLMDFTKIVVNSNYISIEFLKESENPEGFIFLWSIRGREKAHQLLKEKKPASPELLKLYDKISPLIRKRHATNLMLAKKYNYSMFMTDQKLYSHVRKLALEDKIYPVQGNLLGNETLNEIGNTLQKSSLKLGIFYMSNAEEYFSYNDNFKTSVNNLPSNTKSIVLRTISVRKDRFPWSPGSEYSTPIGFHYAVQKLENFKKWLNTPRKNLNSLAILLEAGDTDKINGVTVISKDPN
ncbi:MAG: hypothetical protein EBS19_02730 [Spirochaetia bacterium]|nr:hypothetical protein [Spirochaetia bacterium]